jgi:hypothetical protein
MMGYGGRRGQCIYSQQVYSTRSKEVRADGGTSRRVSLAEKVSLHGSRQLVR